jgi:Ca2+/Na+ antiporter
MFQAMDGRAESGAMIMVAAALLYVATRMAVYALARPDGSDPGRGALGQWLPIAATTTVAILSRRADIAVAVIFGTSVACLSLVLGSAMYLTPMQSPPVSRKVWPFVLPAALLPMMAGFSAHLTWWHALMLLALGGAILAVWRESAEVAEEPSSPRRPQSGFKRAMALAAIAIACIGAHFAVSGAIAANSSPRFGSTATLAATVLSALLVLPTLGTASAVAQRGNPGLAVSALVGTVLLNLCLLLPIAILLWYPLSTTPARLANFRDFKLPWESTHALPYDVMAWRIETVIVVVLGFGLIPASMGRLKIGRLESVLLVTGYGVYVVLMAVFGLQMI